MSMMLLGMMLRVAVRNAERRELEALAELDEARARTVHLERSMREVLALLSSGDFEKAWKLVDYAVRSSESNSKERGR